MRSLRILALCGLTVAMGLTMGMSGCQGGVIGDDYVDMRISRSSILYWGHSTFSVTSRDGHVLLIDPYSAGQTGYSRYETSADVVLVSHEAYDHNDTSWCTNKPAVIHGVDASGAVAAVDQTVGPFRVRTVAAKRGGPAGQDNGNTAMFLVEVDGVRIVHLGDLGQGDLDVSQVAVLQDAHFLMVPVGGGLTISGQQACHIVDQLRPGYVLPMHYRTEATVAPLSEQIGTVDEFLEWFYANPVVYNGNGISLSYADIPTQPELLLLKYLP